MTEMERWQRNIVVVSGTAGGTIGTGFLLCGGAGLVVTCAHVVIRGFGANAASKGAPGPSVSFSDALEKPVATTVFACEPTWDICVLKLVEPCPTYDGMALELEPSLRGRTGMAWGFPGGLDRGVHEPRVMIEAEVTTRTGVSLWQLASHRVTPGFSGGPLVDVTTKRVLGVLTEILATDEFGKMADVAYASPVASIVIAATPAVLLNDWKQSLLLPKRVGEIAVSLSAIYSRLEGLLTQPGSLTPDNNLFLNDTQDYLAGEITAMQYRAKCDAAAPVGSRFDLVDLTQRLKDGTAAIFMGSRFLSDLGFSPSSQHLAQELGNTLAAGDRD